MAPISAYLMARLRALDLVRPFTALMPEVQKPYGKVEQYERLVYTVAGGVLFAVLSELPLHGVKGSIELPDPVGDLRYVVGSANGTPLDIGPSVIYLSGFILQILAGFKVLNVSLDVRSDRALFQSAQKLLALFLTLLLASASVLSGTYGSPASLGAAGSFSLVGQLVLGNLALILIDEVLTKGYGLGTGLLVFSSVKCAQKFTWSLMSMLTVMTPRGQQTVGVLPALVFGVNQRSIKYSVADAAFRSDLPNAVGGVLSVVGFFAAVWLSAVRYQAQITSTRARSQTQPFPIRLLYTNAQPLLFVASLLSVVYQLSSYAYAAFGESVALFGRWEIQGYASVCTSGLVHYLQPSGLSLASVTFVLFVTVVSGIFSRLWTVSSGFGPSDLARGFKEQQVVLVGRRDQSLKRELKKLILPISLLGGFTLGGLFSVLEVLGGSGLVMAVGALNMLNVYEILGNENVSQESLMNARQGF